VFEGVRGVEVVAQLSYIDLDYGSLRGGTFWRVTRCELVPVDNVRFELAYGYGTLDRFGLEEQPSFPEPHPAAVLASRRRGPAQGSQLCGRAASGRRTGDPDASAPQAVCRGARYGVPCLFPQEGVRATLTISAAR